LSRFVAPARDAQWACSAEPFDNPPCALAQAELSLYNVPAFFRHAYEAYSACDATSPSGNGGDGDVEGGGSSAAAGEEGGGGDDGDGGSGGGSEPRGPPLLFDRVFDDDVVRRTLHRFNSLNMLALKKYGTVSPDVCRPVPSYVTRGCDPGIRGCAAVCLTPDGCAVPCRTTD